MDVRDAFLIGGRWTTPSGDEMVDVISPATEQVFGRVPRSTPEDIDAAVAAAREAFESGPWPRLTARERGRYLLEMVAVLQPRLEEAVRLQIDEMGSPYSFMYPTTGGILASMGREIEEIEEIDTYEVRDGLVGKVVVTRDPIGVVAGVIPWNAPIALVLSKMLPALMTGCPFIVKPAPETPLSAYLIADAALQVGLPDGVFSVIPGGGDIGEHLVKHPGVDRVSFTGSSETGTRIAALCGAQLKGVTLELGGKSAAIVLPDADLDEHLNTLIASSLPNNGQVCYATTRVLVPRSRSSEIVERLVAAIRAMKVGDPHDPATAFGPLVAHRQRERVESYIASGLEQGARIALGGGRPSDLPIGWYVEPTIFTGVDRGMRIAREEIFGPVLCIFEYNDENEAVEIANDSDFGLGGAVFTSDIEHGLELAARMRTGTCRVNEAPAGGGGGPFGGVRRSGLGREHGREGFDSYFELKSIALPRDHVPEKRDPASATDPEQSVPRAIRVS